MKTLRTCFTCGGTGVHITDDGKPEPDAPVKTPYTYTVVTDDREKYRVMRARYKWGIVRMEYATLADCTTPEAAIRALYEERERDRAIERARQRGKKGWRVMMTEEG